jgi:hypothetical protein
VQLPDGTYQGIPQFADEPIRPPVAAESLDAEVQEDGYLGPIEWATTTITADQLQAKAAKKHSADDDDEEAEV